LIEIGSKTAEKNSAQTNKQTDKQTDTTKIMVTWPWTNYLIDYCCLYTAATIGANPSATFWGSVCHDREPCNRSSAVAQIDDRLATIDMTRKVGVLWWCAPFHGGAGSSSNTMSPGPRPVSVPSGILIYPTVWPKCTNVTDRTDRRMVP